MIIIKEIETCNDVMELDDNSGKSVRHASHDDDGGPITSSRRTTRWVLTVMIIWTTPNPVDFFDFNAKKEKKKKVKLKAVRIDPKTWSIHTYVTQYRRRRRRPVNRGERFPYGFLAITSRVGTCKINIRVRQ